jgi:hypothetical protein
VKSIDFSLALAGIRQNKRRMPAEWVAREKDRPVKFQPVNTFIGR